MKDNKWVWIIVILGFVLFIQPGGITHTQTNIQNILSKFTGEKVSTSGSPNFGNPDTDFIAVRLYDKDGNQIKIPQTYSVVGIAGQGNVSGVDSLDFTVGVTNTGTRDLTCSISTITPSQFDQVSPKTELPVFPTKRATWTSERISTAPLEQASPWTITATLSCYYYDGLTKVPIGNKVGTLSLYITSFSGIANFTVSVNIQGLPTEYCGDNICQSPMENQQICPKDCSPLPYIKFRTTDDFYVSGSAIAFGTACNGNVLTKYGYTSAGCWAQTDASCPSKTGLTKVISSGVPRNPTWASTGYGCVYQNNTDSTSIILAFKQSGTSGPCGGTGTNQWGTINYNTGSSYAALADNSAYSSQNPNLEVTCP